MRSRTMILVVLLAVFVCQGCDQTQTTALLGALGTGLIGSQLGDSSDRTRNALIGTAIGAAGGYFYGKNKQNQSGYNQGQCPAPVYQQQPRYSQEQLMQMEIERLRRENEQLKCKEKNIISL